MILVLGAAGQVARALGTHADVQCFGRDRVDLMQPGQGAQLIARTQPNFVINAAAFTDVDRAETAADAAYQLNAHAVAEVAQACALRNIPLIHISTDYVFDGTGDQPWQSQDTPNPLNVYGASKLLGEQMVQAAGGVHVILRTSWVFDGDGKNFVTTMQHLGQTRDQVQVVADQIGGPTPAAAIAAACLQIGAQLCVTPEKTGIYHFAGTPFVSWADFARAIFKAQGTACRVQDIASADYPTAAKRPLNSRLATSRIMQIFDITPCSWVAELAVARFARIKV